MQRSFQALVGHGSEARLVTQWTWLAIFPNTLDARLAIVVSAAVDELRLAKDSGGRWGTRFGRCFCGGSTNSHSYPLFFFVSRGGFLSSLSLLPPGASQAISLASRHHAFAKKPFLLAQKKGVSSRFGILMRMRSKSRTDRPSVGSSSLTGQMRRPCSIVANRPETGGTVPNFYPSPPSLPKLSYYIPLPQFFITYRAAPRA